MYAIEFESLISQHEYLEKPILFFSCISFEERCKKAAKTLHNLVSKDIVWKFFQLIDNGSYFETECLEIQNKLLDEIVEIIKINKDEVRAYNLFNSQPWEKIISYFKETVNENPNIKTIILDVTTIPKICYFRFLKWLLEEGLQEKDLIICYTKPQKYTNEEIESDPIGLEILIDGSRSDKDILWIPSLGFNSAFTNSIYNKLKEDRKDIEIIPLIGFPSYRPDYFDKCLLMHIKENNTNLTSSLRKPLLASADDPFEVYEKVMKTIESYKDKDIIFSPIGTKPISIGLALVAILENLQVVSIQPGTYSPFYSIGEGSTSAYWIKRKGEYTFR